MSYDTRVDNKERFLGMYGSDDHAKSMLGKSDSHDNIIATNPNISKETALKLAGHEKRLVRADLAGSTTHKEVLDKLSRDDEYLVKASVMENHHSSTEHLDNVLDNHHTHHAIEDFAQEISEHPNASKKHLEGVKDLAYSNMHWSAYTPIRRAKMRLDKGDHK